jgi:hypothetical protein
MAATLDPVDGAEQAAREARDSRTVEVLARVGLAARGLVWLVLAALAFELLRGGDAQADQDGALEALSSTPGGGVLHRLRSAGKGLVYVALGVSTGLFLLRGSGSDSTSSRTAEAMSYPGGRTAVGLVGLAVVGLGGYLMVKGIRRKHADCLEDYRVPGALRRPAIVCGAVGYVGRGFTLVLIGTFLSNAALQFDPQEAKGLDAALQSVVQQPFGRVLLGLTVVGMLGYALWSFVEAAYREI